MPGLPAPLLLSVALAAAPIEPQARALDPELAGLEVAGRVAPPATASTIPERHVQEDIKREEPASPPSPPPDATPLPIDDAVYIGCGRLVPACERLTTVGLITGGVGLAAITGAAALLLTPDRVIADEPAYIRSTQPVGTMVMALGIGLTTTAILMVLTAARATNKQRRRAAALARLGAGGPT